MELGAVDSNRNIEEQYKEELLAFFNSGIFLFDKQFNNDPIKLQNALIEHYSNDKLKKIGSFAFCVGSIKITA